MSFNEWKTCCICRNFKTTSRFRRQDWQARARSKADINALWRTVFLTAIGLSPRFSYAQRAHSFSKALPEEGNICLASYSVQLGENPSVRSNIYIGPHWARRISPSARIEEQPWGSIVFAGIRDSSILQSKYTYPNPSRRFIRAQYSCESSWHTQLRNA